jgi:hypothetical protein
MNSLIAEKESPVISKKFISQNVKNKQSGPLIRSLDDLEGDFSSDNESQFEVKNIKSNAKEYI